MDIKLILTKDEPFGELQLSAVNQKSPAYYTLKEVSKHFSYDSCWIIVWNRIYNVTDYLQQHPGGMEIILEFAGSDATSAFIDKGHSRVAVEILEDYYIGELTPEDRLYPDYSSP
ncbi:cytochrome b5-like [Paramacrobiotus metropolitanus]|uniref:cytochrome b5-like n=1 Tax=Paramacrobiotus metropolitanus TaxID=2943436 RepID=UPI002445B69F|nr:cytochrome b5-like [Paramacrobiotus metropolitanus]